MLAARLPRPPATLQGFARCAGGAARWRRARCTAPRTGDEPAVKPALLFYCQHAIGMGHLVRSLALAEALAQHFRVVFLSGGRLPRGLPVPTDVELRTLPPLGMDEHGRLVSLDGRRSVEDAQQVRRARLVAAYEEIEPAAIVVELFPFGRKKFAPEL